MGWTRACVRTVILIAATSAVFVVWTLGRPVAWVLGRSLAWRHLAYRTWARACCRCLGMRTLVRGRPPPAPCVLVSNHLSYVDIVLLASQVDCVFVSKAEIARWPGMGFVARCAGTIFVERASKRRLPEVNALIEAALEQGERVAIFPEGTSSGGQAVLPFKPSLLEPAAASRYPVYCAALSYRTAPGYPPASEAVCWWGDMTFGDHVFRLLRMSHFHASLELGQESFLQDDRKELAHATWRTVAAMHEALPDTAVP